MLKTYFALALISLVLIFAVLPVTQAQTVAPPNNDEVARQVFAIMNTFRRDNGVAPLAWSPTLAQLAVDQASYIYPISGRIGSEPRRADQVWDAWHYDGQGRDPFQRALSASWTYYNNNPAAIEIGENTGLGTVNYVTRTFWQNHDFHRRAALNPTFREGGVAAIQYPSGEYLIFQVFGARPNVLTALIDPLTNTLYLTNERSRYARSFPNETLRVVIEDMDGGVLRDSVYVPSLTAPGVNPFLVTFNASGILPISVEVNRADLSDLAIFSDNLTQLSVTPTPTTPPTLPPPTPAATNDPTRSDLRLVYTNNTLFLFNAEGLPLDLTGLALGNAATTIDVTRWNILDQAPYTEFNQRNCLVIQDVTQPPDAQPPGCTFVVSDVELQPSSVFWRSGTFSVLRDGIAIQTCRAEDRLCSVRWN
ncbi:MAG: hypothetical protein IAE80_09065 [Anaerolinea sp.]|nr:hypothetical protein [Anaerolinea sp.]